MSDVKWIKIVTDIFDDEKVLLIESLPSADSIIVIWFKLLCLAGKNNNNGVFLLNDRIAYTEEMLATIFRRDINTVRLALKTFEEYGMIEIVEGVITIPNWGKHQSLDKLENKKEYMRNYMKEYRQKQKKLIGVNKYNEIGLAPNEWKNVLEEFNYQCAYCGSSEDLEQDHVVSVKNGGEYAVGNIVPACRRCNASKNDKEVFEWYKEQDFYDENRCKNLHEYLRKYLHKTNVNSLDIDNKDNKEKDNKDKKEIKHKHGEYHHVLLTDTQYSRLVNDYGEKAVIDGIENVDKYCQKSGRTYKDYNLVLRDWGIKSPKLSKPIPSQKKVVEEPEMTEEEYIKLLEAEGIEFIN